MASEKVQVFTDGNFEERVLKSPRARAGGFLGGVVRALQPHRADGRCSSRRISMAAPTSAR